MHFHYETVTVAVANTHMVHNTAQALYLRYIHLSNYKCILMIINVYINSTILYAHQNTHTYVHQCILVAYSQAGATCIWQGSLGLAA